MITSIKREFDLSPNIVGIITTDNLATITTTDYFSTQLVAIELLNNGVWQWEVEDICLIYYSAAQIGFFTYDATTDTFISLAANGGLSNTLASADIFVGNGANVATGVPMSGVIAITNAGVTSIVDGSIVNADINAAAAIDFSKLAALPSAEILVGSAGNIPAAVAVTGDVVISNAGVTAISAGVIINTDINAAAAIAFSKLAALPSGDILVGSVGTVPTAVAMSGDATIIASGALTIAPAAVTSSKLDPTLIQTAQVTMSAAQFNGAYAAPLLLVAAPGANTMIVVDSIALVMTYGSAAFAAGGVVAAQYDSTAYGAGVIATTTESADDFFATASTVFKLNPGAVLAPFTTCANKGLYLSNVTQAFTTGTGSAFIVKVRYHLISTVA
jgi:hypothetical protein